MKWLKIKVDEPQHMNLQLLVEGKINTLVEQQVEPPFFVEHTGLIIEQWNGLPGGLSALFMNTVGNEGICKMMRAYKGPERAARAVVVIGYYYPGVRVEPFVGEVEGLIAPEPRGTGDFGWDSLFIPTGASKTYAEMSLVEKNTTSMRKGAADRFARYLARHFEL
jgi:non-canonical purine NTP pyrophosphatase (RdgB/HAM1 family)